MTKEIINFWKEIIYKNGKIDEKQVMKELSDFSYVMEQVPKVYSQITNGLLSKIMYPADVVLTEFYDKFWDKGMIREDINDILNSKQNEKDKLKEIKEYINI